MIKRLLRGFSLMRVVANMALITVLFAADFFSKQWAMKALQEKGVILCRGLTLDPSFNQGLSWSMFSTNSAALQGLFAILIVCVLLGFLFFVVGRSGARFLLIPEMMVLAGGLSNLFDRMRYGAVVDFIDCYVGAWHWPTFNFADVYIVVGIAMIVKRMWADGDLGKN